jgi:hypothetical protein
MAEFMRRTVRANRDLRHVIRDLFKNLRQVDLGLPRVEAIALLESRMSQGTS